MALPLPFFAGLALVLGFKHAFDADHLVAVGGLLTRGRRLDRVLGLSAAWAVGHMATASLLACVLYYFADSVLPRVVARVDLLVPAMLLAVGVLGLLIELRRLHYHRHAHARGGPEHGHFHVHLKPHHEHGAMAGIGVVHGLASNDELLVVLVTGLGAEQWWQVFLGVALFSVGVLAGMSLYAAGVHVASAKTGRPWIPSALAVAFSVLSIGYAAYLFLGGPGLNVLAIP